MEKYIQLAKDLKMIDVKFITPRDIFFDLRAMLKCRWGCENFIEPTNVICHSRETTYEERIAMIKAYKNILLLHSHNAR